MSNLQIVLSYVAFAAYAALAIGTVWIWWSLILDHRRGGDRTPSVTAPRASGTSAPRCQLQSEVCREPGCPRPGRERRVAA